MAKKTRTPRPAAPRSDGTPAPTPRARRVAPLEPPAERAPTAREIAERAYYLYLERGGSPGSDVDDWIRAERELREARTGKQS